VGRQVAASTIEFAACVCRTRGCLCNCEELVAFEKLDAGWKLGRHRILRLAYGAIAERHFVPAKTRALNLSSKRFGSLPLNCQSTAGH